MLLTCWVTKATDTHTHTYNTFALPLQQWLRERVTTLRYSTMPGLFRRCYECAVASTATSFKRLNELPHFSRHTFRDLKNVSKILFKFIYIFIFTLLLVSQE